MKDKQSFNYHGGKDDPDSRKQYQRKRNSEQNENRDNQFKTNEFDKKLFQTGSDLLSGNTAAKNTDLSGNSAAFDLSSFASRDAHVNKQKKKEGLSSKKGKTSKSSSPEADSKENDKFSTGGVPVPGGKKKRKKKRSVPATIGRVMLSLFLIVIITGSLVGGAFAVYVFGFVDDSVGYDLDDLALNFTTTVYVMNKDTGEYEEYQRLHGGYNRIWVSIDDMPQNLIDAFIAIEDKRFYTHNGVDWKRTFSAFANMFVDLYSSNQGGSTITQQLVKNLTGDDDKSEMRKIREIMRARKMEDTYSKDTIIECYLNTITMANGIYGVEVASNYYFNKTTSELTLEECAALAAMTKEPERYRPDTKLENNDVRRITVLKEMLTQEFITQEEYDAAGKAPLNVDASKLNTKEIAVNSYFIDALIDDVIQRFIDDKDYDKDEATRLFYNGGFKIYCTLDTDAQKILDDVYADNKNFMTATSSKDKAAIPQSASTIMDYEGHVVAIIGGRGEKTVNRGLNRATSSPRQPGSTIKPISAYAPAIEYNMITYSSHQNDKPIQIKEKGVTKNWPVNSNGGYSGMTTVQNAIARSLNTIPVRIVQELTPQKSYDFLKNKMGITTLVESEKKSDGTVLSDINLSSLALGGASYGTTTLEMAAAYATFGNLGKYYRPSTFTKVTDQHDEIVLEATPSAIAMGEDTANIMNHLLQGVITGTSGTGRSAKFGSMPLFGKTGTTDDNNDRWFIGGSPYYVAATWFGFDMPAKLNLASNPALKVWKAFMEPLNEGLEYKDFPDTEYVSYRRYCTASGMVATENCHSTQVGWFKTSYLPSCTTHKGPLAAELEKPGAPKPVSSTVSGTASKKPSSSGAESKALSSTAQASATATSKAEEASSQAANSVNSLSPSSAASPSSTPAASKESELPVDD